MMDVLDKNYSVSYQQERNLTSIQKKPRTVLQIQVEQMVNMLLEREIKPVRIEVEIHPKKGADLKSVTIYGEIDGRVREYHAFHWAIKEASEEIESLFQDAVLKGEMIQIWGRKQTWPTGAVTFWIYGLKIGSRFFGTTVEL